MLKTKGARMRGSSRLGPVGLAAVLVAAALVSSPAPVAADSAVPPPDEDPFYDVAAGLDALANGTVIKSRPIDPMAIALPLPAVAWHVQYKSIDNHGDANGYVATVLVPKAAWSGAGPRPLVSYQVAEDGVGLKCAPSYALRAGLGTGTLNNSDLETNLKPAKLRKTS